MRNFTAIRRSGLYNDTTTIAAAYPEGAITLGLLTKEGVLGKCVRGVKYERKFSFMPGAEGFVIEARGEYHKDGDDGVYNTVINITKVGEKRETPTTHKASFPSNNLNRGDLLSKAIAEALALAGITESSVSHMKMIPLFSGMHLAKEA